MSVILRQLSAAYVIKQMNNHVSLIKNQVFWYGEKRLRQDVLNLNWKYQTYREININICLCIYYMYFLVLSTKKLINPTATNTPRPVASKYNFLSKRTSFLGGGGDTTADSSSR